MPLIGFKDKADGFYQAELAEGEIPDWAKDMTQLTEAERLAELVVDPTALQPKTGS